MKKGQGKGGSGREECWKGEGGLDLDLFRGPRVPSYATVCNHTIIVIIGSEKSNCISYFIKKLSYADLIHLGLPTLKYRRLRGDMIEIF